VEIFADKVPILICLAGMIVILIIVQIHLYRARAAQKTTDKHTPPASPPAGKTPVHEDPNPPLIDGEIVVEGVLVRVLVGPGTKSEHWGYVLHTAEVRTADRREIRVEMERDNPFQHETLAPLETRLVRVTGRIWGGRLIGRHIRVLGE
jgi:hypothetical protein